MNKEKTMNMFINYYECPNCKNTWMDVWECTCDDTCPYCETKNVSPHISRDLIKDDISE